MKGHYIGEYTNTIAELMERISSSDFAFRQSANDARSQPEKLAIICNNKIASDYRTVDTQSTVMSFLNR